MLCETIIRGKKMKYFDSRVFEVDGRRYEIIGTRLTGRGIYDAVDTVKNDKGEYRDFTRLDLIKFIECRS